jgi:hypothetical protein
MNRAINLPNAIGDGDHKGNDKRIVGETGIHIDGEAADTNRCLIRSIELMGI